MILRWISPLRKAKARLLHSLIRIVLFRNGLSDFGLRCPGPLRLSEAGIWEKLAKVEILGLTMDAMEIDLPVLDMTTSQDL